MERVARSRGTYRHSVIVAICAVLALYGCGGGGGGGGGGGSTPPVGPTVQSATVQGIVTDDAGNPVDDALVIVGTSSWTSRTGRDGSFAVPNVPHGNHPIRVIKNGHDLGQQASVVVSGALKDVGEILLPAPSAGAPVLSNLRLDPATGPDNTQVTARVDASNVGSAGTVILASPELEKTWTMALETGATYKAMPAIAAKSGITAYRFFAAAIDGTKVGDAPQGAVFTLTGATAVNANVSGIWKFYAAWTSPAPKDTTALFWIHQEGTSLAVVSHPGSSSGSVSGNAVSFSTTDSEGSTYSAAGTVQGTEIEGTWSKTGGDSGTFVASRVMEEANVPTGLGSGPVTIGSGQYFDLSTGTASASSGDFRFNIASGSGSIATPAGISAPEDRTESGFRVDLAFQPLLDASRTWLGSRTLYAPTASYTPCTVLVRTKEQHYGILWIASASSGGMTFRYLYPYRGNSYDWGTPPSVSGMTASGPVQAGDNVVAGWTGTAGSAPIDHYETWIDAEGTMAATVVSPARNFSTSGLSVGVHTFYVRAVQSDTIESAVGSVAFTVTPLVRQATVGFTNVDSGQGTGTLTLLRTAFGLTSYGFNAAPPDFLSIGSPELLPAAPALGQSWSHSGYSNTSLITTTATVTSLADTVSVTAGTFANCVRIEEENSFPPAYAGSWGAPSHRTRWFAPGVGPVRYETVYVNSSGAVVSTAIGQLTSYTLAYTAPNNLWPLAIGNTWVIQESDQASTCTWAITGVQQ